MLFKGLPSLQFRSSSILSYVRCCISIINQFHTHRRQVLQWKVHVVLQGRKAFSHLFNQFNMDLHRNYLCSAVSDSLPGAWSVFPDLITCPAGWQSREGLDMRSPWTRQWGEDCFCRGHKRLPKYSCDVRSEKLFCSPIKLQCYRLRLCSNSTLGGLSDGPQKSKIHPWSWK